MSNLEDLRAERARLDAAIAAEEKLTRDSWNDALFSCQMALKNWLYSRSIEAESQERKNAEIWDIGHGALEVTFVFADEQYGPGRLFMVSGPYSRSLKLEWNHVPETERLFAIVATLLNEPQDA